MSAAVLAATVFVALLPLGVGLLAALVTEEQPLRRRAQASQQTQQHARQGLGFVRGRRIGHGR